MQFYFSPAKPDFSFLNMSELGLSKPFSSDCHNDYATMIIPAFEAVYWFSSKFREARDAKGNLLYLNGNCRREVINSLPFVDPISGTTIDLSDLREIYSSKWLEGVRAEF
jgi:hypothetical protein